MHRAILVFTLLVTLLFACSSDTATPAGDGAADRVSYELGPRTKLLDARALAALTAGADTAQTLSFDESYGSTLARGDVLLSGASEKTPRGLLRLVRGVKTEAGKTQVDTVLVPLQLAFKKLDLHVERRLSTSGEPPPPPAGLKPLVKLFEFGGETPLDRIVFDADKNLDTLENQLRIKSLYKGGLDITMDVSFDWGILDTIIGGLDTFLECTGSLGLAPGCDLSLPKLTVKLEFNAGVATTFDQSGAASIPYETEKFKVGEPRVFEPVGVFPFVFVPEVGFEGRGEGNAGSYSHIAGHSEVGFHVKAALSTDGDVSVKGSPTNTFEVTKVDAFLDARASTKIGPTLKMMMFGALGPTIGVDFESELDIDRRRGADCYHANVSINGNFGFEVRFPWQALGTAISKDPEVGKDVAKVAGIFGLDGTIFETSKSVKLLDKKQVAAGPCQAPPANTLPPGIPPDDILANPPFVPWAQRWDEPGDNFQFSASPANVHTRLALAADGSYWGVASPGTVLRKFSLDGQQLSARRFLARIEEKDVPLALSDVLVRKDLTTWLLFQNGDVVRFTTDGQLESAYHYTVPLGGPEEEAILRFGATAPDGRSALVFGISQIQNTYDNRFVVVELTKNGAVERAQAIGYPTATGVQTELFSPVRALYNQAGDLVIVGNDVPGKAELDSRCFAFSLRKDGTLGFATNMATARSTGTCESGGLTEAPNGELLIPAIDGYVFTNNGITIALDKNGVVSRSAAFQLGGDSFIEPTAMLPLASSGYILVGRDALDANRPGTFVLRLDALGKPLDGKVYRPKTSAVQLGYPDALYTKDAGVVFGQLADWVDFASGTGVTRFFAGKSYAKDGDLPFAAGADAEVVGLKPTSVVTQVTGTSFTRPLAPVTVTLAPITLKMEDVPLTTTTFAP